MSIVKLYENVDYLTGKSISSELLLSSSLDEKYFFRLNFSGSEIEKGILRGSFVNHIINEISSKEILLDSEKILVITARDDSTIKSNIPDERFGVYDSDIKKGFVYYRNKLGMNELEKANITIFIENGFYSDRQSIKDINQINETTLFDTLLNVLKNNESVIFKNITENFSTNVLLELLLNEVRRSGTSSIVNILDFLQKIDDSLIEKPLEQAQFVECVSENLPILGLYKDSGIIPDLVDITKIKADQKKDLIARIRLNINMAMGLDERRNNWTFDSYTKRLDHADISYDELVNIKDKTRLSSYDLTDIFPTNKKKQKNNNKKSNDFDSFKGILKLIEDFRTKEILTDEEADSFSEQAENIAGTLEDVIETKGSVGIRKGDSEIIKELLDKIYISISNNKTLFSKDEYKNWSRNIEKIQKSLTRAEKLSDGQSYESKLAFEILKTLESNRNSRIKQKIITFRVPYSLMESEGENVFSEEESQSYEDLQFFIGSSIMPFIYAITKDIQSTDCKTLFNFEIDDASERGKDKTKDISTTVEFDWEASSKKTTIEWMITSEDLLIWKSCNYIAKNFVQEVKNVVEDIEYSFFSNNDDHLSFIEEWKLNTNRKINFIRFKKDQDRFREMYVNLCSEIKNQIELSYIPLTTSEENKYCEYNNGEEYISTIYRIYSSWVELAKLNLENASAYGVEAQKFSNALLYLGAVFLSTEKVFISAISPLSTFTKISEIESVKNLIKSLLADDSKRINFVQKGNEYDSLNELISAKQFPAYLHYEEDCLYVRPEGYFSHAGSILLRFNTEEHSSENKPNVANKVFSQSVSRVIRKYLGVYPFSVYATDIYFKGISDHTGILDVIKQVQRPYIDADTGTTRSYLVNIVNDGAEEELTTLQDRIYRTYRDDLDLQHSFQDQGYESVKIGFSSSEIAQDLPLKNKNFAVLYKPEHDHSKPTYEDFDESDTSSNPFNVGYHFEKTPNVEAHGSNIYIKLNAGNHDEFVSLAYLLSSVSYKPNQDQNHIGNSKRGFKYKYLQACIKSDRSLDLIKKLAEDFHWVILYDHTLEKSAIKAQLISPKNSDDLHILEYRSDLKDTCAIIVVSKEDFSDFSNAIATSISKIGYPTVSKKITKQILEQAMDISGSILLKAAGKGKFLQEMLGIVCTKRIFDSLTFKEETLASGWVYVDDYGEWFPKNRPDLIYYRLTNETLELYCIEVKFRDDSTTKKTVEDATIQVCSALQLLTRTFTSKNGLIDQRIWIRQIFKSLRECIDTSFDASAVKYLREKEEELLSSIIKTGTVPKNSVKLFGNLSLFSHNSLADTDKSIQHILTSASGWKQFLPPDEDKFIKLRNSETNVNRFDLEGSIFEMRFTKEHIKELLNYEQDLELTLNPDQMATVDIHDDRLNPTYEKNDDDHFQI